MLSVSFLNVISLHYSIIWKNQWNLNEDLEVPHISGEVYTISIWLRSM